MTKKIFSFIFPLILVLFFASNVYAQTLTTNTGTTSAASKLNQQMEFIQDQKKAAISQIRTDAKAMIQTQRDDFKAKLQAIRDQRKKALVARIDAKLAQVNKNHTDRFLDILTRLQGFLDKVKQSTTDTNILADVTTAQTAIDVAKAAVTTQAEKTYTITITDDATLRLNVGTTTSQFRQDIMAVYKLVIDAKQAVVALRIDKTIMRKEATNSAKTSL